MGGRKVRHTSRRRAPISCAHPAEKNSRPLDIQIIRHDTAPIDYQPPGANLRYRAEMDDEAISQWRVRRSPLRAATELVGNCAAGLGALFVVDHAAGLGIGTPGGSGGALIGAAMIVGGLVAALLPVGLRRIRWALASRARRRPILVERRPQLVA